MTVVITAVISAVLTWIFSEVTHRRSAKRRAVDQVALLHKREQVKILSELQDVVLRYYGSYSEYLWGAWEEKKGRLSKKQIGYLQETWTEMEELALRLFALAARIDDLQIRSKIDMLEEIARWNTVSPGEHSEDGAVTTSSANILKDDQAIQRRAIEVNRLIGDRQLKLLGSSNPEDELQSKIVK